MQSGYTCRQCFNSLKKRGLVQEHLRNPSSYLRSTNSKWISTKITTDLSRIKDTQPRTSPFQSRRALSLAQQGQYAVEEPLGVPTSLMGVRELMKPNNLFHPFSKSPSPEIRRRAAFIKQHAYCPHPSHQATRTPSSPHDPEARKAANARLPPAHVRFECPDCGIPVSCSEEHWADDYENHLEICDYLREINEDDHDLRSGRFFTEFEYPGPQMEEALVNITNWDTLLYTRQFTAINEERSMRHATRLLTYPVTIGSILHELSPYNIRRGGRLTPEGLKSLSGMFNLAFSSGNH